MGMHPILLKAGKINIYSWGLMLAIALIAAFLGIGRLAAREGYEKEIVWDLVIIMAVSGILGARLTYILLYEREVFLSNPLSFISLSSGGLGGLVWYGALAGGFISFVLYIWKKGLPFWQVSDIFAPFLALGYAIGRIGCFLNGCCYGKVTESVFGVVFPYVDEFARHPTQLYSSALNLLLFIFLLWYYPRRKFEGQLLLFYLMGYAVYRFLVEFFRDNLVMYGIFSMGQVYTAGLFIAAALFYLWRRSKAGRT
jgi:phosphatidylglycerol:prolipoprotein diacylglycerol transferase